MKGLWKKTASIVLSASLLTGSWLGAMPGMMTQAKTADENVQQEFYVSVNGDDNGDGSKENPFATVERARQAVDEVNDNMTGNIIVNIGAGEYYLDETICLNENDSGSNGYQVIYRSEDGLGEARLNGGVLVNGWEETTDADIEMGLDESLVGKVYKVQLDPEEYDFNALYVNDEKATMARTRNYQHDERFPSQRGEYMYSVGGGMRDLIWKEGDLDQKAIDGMVAAQERGEEEIAQLFVWDGGNWDWFTNTLPVNGIDVSQRKVWATEYPDQPERNRTKYPIGSGARYYLQGNLAFLDVPGEYHYNKATGELYYYPKEGQEDLDAQKVVVPMVQEIFRLEGSDKPTIPEWGNEPDMTKQVSNVVFDGLVLKNTEYTNYFTSGWNYSDAGGGIWEHAPEAEGSTNPSYDEQTDRTEYKVGAITLINSNHVTIENTQIHNTGLWAVAMFKDNTYHTIQNCDFGYNGYGSITIDGGYPGVGKYCNHITVQNVRMHDVGQNIGHAAGLTVMSCGQSDFRNLEIYNTPRRAIMVSGGPKRDGTDAQLDQITDMYTIGNHFEYIYVYNGEQDSGEDSAVYVCMLFRSGWIQDKYPKSEYPEAYKVDEDGREYFDICWDGVDRHNYFNQMLIDNIGSNPSMRDKNTVHGMDLCMGVTGQVLSNIKGTNNQSCTLRIFEESYDKLFLDNLNNNYKSDELINQFDDSKMEYDKIGLTDEFPFPEEFDPYPEEEVPEDIYFSDDFESGNVDPRKWTEEKGNAKVSNSWIAEGPHDGVYSLALDGNRNKSNGGVVLSRTFEQDLNKIVEVKYFDKRQDYARSDVNEEATAVDITPDAWVRVDNGTDVVAIGANGDISKDYYLYKNGEEVIQTEVPRKFGWHTFKFDYTSKTDVKMYIDDELVATLPAESFNYLGMGDWTGNGGASYYDQIYIYGGEYAPPVEDLPLPTPPAEIDSNLYEEDFEGYTIGDENIPEDWTEIGKGDVATKIVEDPENAENKVMYATSQDNSWYFLPDTPWSNYTFECKVRIDSWGGGLEGEKPWDNFAPAVYANQEGNPKRYALKFNREGNFEAYGRTNGDNTYDSITAEELGITEANSNHTGQWYDVKIETKPGKITMYLNGKEAMHINDSSLTAGGFGFDGINVRYYVDDIKVTASATGDPTADVEEGTYQAPIDVLLTPENAEDDIFYTLDGSDPTDPEKGQYYITGEPIHIEKTSTLKFVAIHNGQTYSNVITKEYTIENGEPVEPADKTLLQKTYDYALTLDANGVVESAVKLFENALANAKAVLDDPDATVDEVSAAWDELLEGIWALGLAQGDKTMLEQLIARADKMMDNADKYVQDNWQQLEDALEKAKEVMNDGDAMEEDVQPAAENLLNAILMQRYKANKDNLQNLIDKVSGMDLSQYTPESVAVFKTALAEANKVLADESLSQDDQKVVDTAVQNLESAVENLEKLSDTSSEESKPEEPSSKPTGGSDSPTTGDSSTPLWISVLLVLMAGCAVLYLNKRKTA